MGLKVLSLDELKKTYAEWEREDEQATASEQPGAGTTQTGQEVADASAMQGLRRVGSV